MLSFECNSFKQNWGKETMKKIMMNSLVLALFAGNAFSSAPASSSSSGPKLGSFAFRDVNEAKKHGVSFDKNNKFATRERVVVHNPDPVRNGGVLVHGIIAGRNKGSWLVEEKSRITYVCNAGEIGKMPQAASNEASASSSSSAGAAQNPIQEPAIQREGKFSLRGGLSHGRQNRGRMISEKEDDESNQAAASSSSSSSSSASSSVHQAPGGPAIEQGCEEDEEENEEAEGVPSKKR
jgi:hypothetical protein